VTFRNPLVVSAVLGIGWSLLRLPMPVPLHDMLSLLGGAATPCALISVGRRWRGADRGIAGGLAGGVRQDGAATGADRAGGAPLRIAAGVDQRGGAAVRSADGAVPTLLARSYGVDPMGPAQASAITTLLSVVATPVVFALFPPVAGSAEQGGEVDVGQRRELHVGARQGVSPMPIARKPAARIASIPAGASSKPIIACGGRSKARAQARNRSGAGLGR
jgi:hypothetical protein